MALKLLNEYLNYADKVFCATLASALSRERVKGSTVEYLMAAFGDCKFPFILFTA